MNVLCNLHSRPIHRKPADAEANGLVGGALDTPLFNPVYDNHNPPDYAMVASTEIGYT